MKKPERPAEVETLARPVAGDIVDDSITMPRPVLVQFELENYDDLITSNNAQTSFEVKIDGQPTHFYFYNLEENNDVATVTLRLEWAVEDGAEISVKSNVSSLNITDVKIGNRQANVNFDIVSANGKGYSVYLSESGVEGPYELYNNVNYNSKGAHIRGLTNGKEYYVYIEYNDGKGNASRSRPVKIN